jgi:hypothetical protein
LEVVGPPVLVIVTVEVDVPQGGLLMVHWNTFGPKPKPVTVVVGEEGVVMVPVPLTSVQVPVPAVGVFAAIVAEVAQTLCAGPAADVVGEVLTVTVTGIVYVPGQNPT